jgi:molybdopterin-guanine dinucleotide biosynthesis protein MobB
MTFVIPGRWGHQIASLTMFTQSLEQGIRGSKTTCVVGVVGFSDTGKTTLLELLIPRLRARDLTVGAVKHASHGFDADQPGKDSHRIYQAGADAVALVSKHQIATFRRRDEGEARLCEALAEMPKGLDLVLVEGFAWEAVPRFVLTRPGEAAAREHVEAGAVLAIVEVAEPLPGRPPVFETDVLEALVEQLEERVAALRLTETRNLVGIRKPWLSAPFESAKEDIRWRPVM